MSVELTDLKRFATMMAVEDAEELISNIVAPLGALAPATSSPKQRNLVAVAFSKTNLVYMTQSLANMFYQMAYQFNLLLEGGPMIMGEVKDRGLLKDEQIKELTETYTKVYLDNIKNTLSMMSMDLNGDAS